MGEAYFYEVFAAIRDAVLEAIPPAFRIGEVVSTNPLRVVVNGTSHAGLECNAALECAAGDRVLLACLENDNRLIVLCKVVK